MSDWWGIGQAVRADAKELNAGSSHVVLNVPYKKGRLTRKRFQALCGADPFDWGQARHGVDCPRCLDMAPRHGIDLAVPIAEAPSALEGGAR